MPIEPVTITEHAERHRILSPENCALPGPYRVAVTPFIKDILDAAGDRNNEKVVCQKSAQVAWTDGVINNCVCYHIDHDPAPMLVLFPTETMAQRYSKEKLAPMIRDTKCLRSKVADPKSRDSGNTILSKNFPGGHLELVGSNAPANLASSPIRVIIVEEPDRCAANSGKEGDALKLVFERGKTFHNRRIILGGSPTIKGMSQIEREMSLTDQRRLEIPCPKCGEYQQLTWKQVVWDKDPNRDHAVFGQHIPETARIECLFCQYQFNNAEKNAQLSKYRWRPTAEFTGAAGFYINELYSPFPKATLTHVVEKFLEAKRELDQGNDKLMITWTNTSLGETWEEKGEGVNEADIATETLTPDVAPDGVLCITAGVDVQIDRLEMEIVGFGDGEESWSLDYQVLYGDPERSDVWDQLDEQLQRVFLYAGKLKMQIECCCVDSGNSTQAVYRYVKTRQPRVFAVKGVEGKNAPYVPNRDKFRKSTPLKKGVRLFTISDQTAMQHIRGKLNVEAPGPGYCHFPDGRPDEYFKQLTGFHGVKRYKEGVPWLKWMPKRKRIEALDCRKYAIAALVIRFGPGNRINWKHLRRRLAKWHAKQEPQKEPTASPLMPSQKKKHKRPISRGGFVKRY